MERPPNPTILLVDDIKIFLDIQKGILEALPVDVLTANDGEEALRLVEQSTPDLIVLDANMPGMDGVACCSTLKQHDRHCRIPVIMTVPNCADNAELCRAAGCDALLRKPLDAGVFLDAVSCFIPLVERRDRRIEVLIPVVVKTGGRECSGVLLNISRSGACLELDAEIENGARLELSFTLPQLGSSPLKLHARVDRLWSPDANGMQGGIGVAFTNEGGDYLRLSQKSRLCRHLGLGSDRR